MKKPYKPDYKPDYEKHEKEGSSARTGIMILSFILAVLWYIFIHDSYWSAFLVMGIVASVLVGLSGVDEQQCKLKAEKEAQEQYEKDMARWEFELKSEEELIERRMLIEIRVKRMNSEIDDEIALNRYEKLLKIQSHQNQHLFSLLNEATLAAKCKNYVNLNENLTKLEKELGI